MKRLQKLSEHYRKDKYTTLVKQEEEQGGGTAKSSLLRNFDFMANIFVEKVSSLDGIPLPPPPPLFFLTSCSSMWTILSAKIGQLIDKSTPLKLVVIDSLTALFRAEYTRDEALERSKILWNYANQLKYISDMYSIP